MNPPTKENGIKLHAVMRNDAHWDADKDAYTGRNLVQEGMHSRAEQRADPGRGPLY